LKSRVEMLGRQYDLLSISVLILGVGLFSALAATGVIGPLETVPLVVAFMGAWLIALTLIQREEKGTLPFDTLSWGLILLVVGGMGFLYARNIFSGFFIPAILIVVGLIGVMAVLRSWRKTE